MAIKHNNFSDGVQSLGHIPAGKKNTVISVGLMEPGTHDFGIVSRDEIINVTYGSIKINGTWFTSTRGDCIIKPGDRVVFEAKNLSSYICFFPNEVE